MSKKKDKSEDKPLFFKIWNVFTTVVVTLVVLLAVALVGVRIVGFEPYAVISPSMTPAYPVGSLVYAKETDPYTIQKGDVITFIFNEDGDKATHRVVDVNTEEKYFTTKGDANDDNDAKPVYFENVVGVVKFGIPLLGYISAYVATTSGKYAAVAVLFLLILILIVPEFFRKDKKKKR